MKATSTKARDAGAVARASEAWLLMIPRALWDILVRQAQSERRTPGEVLSDAVAMYLRERGDAAVKRDIGDEFLG